MPRCRSGKLSRYGDLMVRSAAGCGDRVARPARDIARMLVGNGGGLDSGMTQLTRDEVTAA